MGDREGKGAMFRPKLSILAPWPGLSLNNSDGCADRRESPPSHMYLLLEVAHPGNQETDTVLALCTLAQRKEHRGLRLENCEAVATSFTNLEFPGPRVPLLGLAGISRDWQLCK